MLNLFDRNGNDAEIVKVSRTQTRNGAYLYHVILNFKQANYNAVKATAYVDPAKSDKMKRLMRVYDRFQAGDQVHANLYQHNKNFIDIYRLQLIKNEAPKPAEPSPVEQPVVTQTINNAANDSFFDQMIDL